MEVANKEVMVIDNKEVMVKVVVDITIDEEDMATTVVKDVVKDVVKNVVKDVVDMEDVKKKEKEDHMVAITVVSKEKEPRGKN